ncbi:hypothetical protein CALVIDRAFT_542886 [Calocera viscosa TUFC12733]|uniref:Uncharacterized protein n=1 Tax=Calocera viscosa (strain TUFC12733) TaxID=1330018 RepID=A0A167G7M6_CALVF|nr:hypothetical protein CALVIDRAFT_542886 [Calocera viscosa TUFC12733]
MRHTASVLIGALLASSVLAAPAPAEPRSAPDDFSTGLSQRDTTENDNIIEGRGSYELSMIIAQGQARANALQMSRELERKRAAEAARKGKKGRRDLDEYDAEVSARDLVGSNGELDERFFFLGPLIAQGVRAGVQAGVRAGVRAGAKKGAQKAAKHGAKQGAKQNNNHNNNKNNNRGKKHKRDLDDLDTATYTRDLIESDGDLDERFFFLGPLIAQGVRAGVQAGVKAGVRAGARKGAKVGAKHAANHQNNNRNSKNGKKHRRSLEDLDGDDELFARSVMDEELAWDLAARDVEEDKLLFI